MLRQIIISLLALGALSCFTKPAEGGSSASTGLQVEGTEAFPGDLSVDIVPRAVRAVTHAERAIAGYKTDLALVKETLYNSLSLDIEDSPLSRGDSVRLKPAAEDKRNWIVGDVLTQVLLEKGCGVSPEESEDSLSVEERVSMLSEGITHTLAFHIGGIKLNYRPKSFLKFFRKSFDRRVQADIILKLIEDKDGAVIWTKWVEAESHDVIPQRYSRILENAGIFERVVVEEGEKLVEAFVTIGILGSIIFFVF